MRKWNDFNVEQIDAVRINAQGSLKGRDLMSPFVWDLPDERMHILLRGVPPKGHAGLVETGSIYYGTGDDGLTFEMQPVPVLSPDPDPEALDHGGCEDPTVLHWNGEYVVYYTGVERTRTRGVMLYATGPDMLHLRKQGVAHRSTKMEGNVKEATIALTPRDKWRLFYEYAHDEASRIGSALGQSIVGPWTEKKSPIEPRRDAWDSWHLSTGPMLRSDPEHPVMFYNGATRDARWRIGWAVFDSDCQRVVDRCIQPLITPPPPKVRRDTDIAFAASILDRGELAHLYYSVNDREVFRALIRSS